jgi:uncharacterized protein (DUF2235 family)
MTPPPSDTLPEYFTTDYSVDLSPLPPGQTGRNVIILMDGTWNDETGLHGDGVVTNVYKLYQSLREDSGRQTARYFRGIGNDDDNNRLGTIFGGAFGAKERRIRHSAYAMIVKQYQPGDHFFILGFSRGAACARMLATQLAEEGIRENIRITTRMDWNRTTRCVENRFETYQTMGKRIDPVIAFLGVWDTVGAFGIPVTICGIPFRKWNLFKNMDVSPAVKKAVHCVSLDETRDPFVPTLMNWEPHQPERIEEVWFPGAHSDVGGGYAEDLLGHLSLKFMTDRMNQQAAALGRPAIEYDPALLKKFTDWSIDEPNDFHFWGLGWNKSVRTVFTQIGDRAGASGEVPQPKIHRSVFNLQQSGEVFSYIARSGKRYRFLYNPFNLKVLNGAYQVVD